MLYENIQNIASGKTISIAELEKRAGLSNGTIGKWRDSMPKIDSLIKVAKVLDVGLSVLTKGMKEGD
jgi:transcriptional regulator with XRE-family HTH domain